MLLAFSIPLFTPLNGKIAVITKNSKVKQTGAQIPPLNEEKQFAKFDGILFVKNNQI